MPTVYRYKNPKARNKSDEILNSLSCDPGHTGWVEVPGAAERVLVIKDREAGFVPYERHMELKRERAAHNRANFVYTNVGGRMRQQHLCHSFV